MLTFPNLAPEDFRPWINEEDAARKALSPDEYANQQAELWKKGLAEWGEDGARIQRLKDAADFAIYTPGSSASLRVSILKSFAAPEAAARDDEEALRERRQLDHRSLRRLPAEARGGRYRISAAGRRVPTRARGPAVEEEVRAA